jgi:hypothetical protein
MTDRYKAFEIDKPYVVETYDCPGIKLLCSHFWRNTKFDIIEHDEYVSEFRFATKEQQELFCLLVDKYLNSEYEILLEKLWEKSQKE